VRENGGALMTDMLVAWCAALTIMLIPLEWQTKDDTPRQSFWRGALWSSALLTGILAKMTFGVVAALTFPALLWVRWRRCGGNALLWTAVGGAVFALPGAAVWALCGRAMIEFGMRFAFSEAAALWGIQGMGAGGYVWRFVTSLSFAVAPLLVLVIFFCSGLWREKKRLYPVAVIIAYLAIAAMGQNREARYTLTVAVALPLALSWGAIGNGQTARMRPVQGFAAALAALMFALPMVGRPRITALRHAGELLDQLASWKPATIVVATDGLESNIEVMQLARQIGGVRLQGVYLDTLVYDAINKRTVQDGYKRMSTADYVLFLRGGNTPGPPWSRQWANEYRAYAEQHGEAIASTASEFEVFRIKKK
jgi:hypothetical protein